MKDLSMLQRKIYFFIFSVLFLSPIITALDIDLKYLSDQLQAIHGPDWKTVAPNNVQKTQVADHLLLIITDPQILEEHFSELNDRTHIRNNAIKEIGHFMVNQTGEIKPEYSPLLEKLNNELNSEDDDLAENAEFLEISMAQMMINTGTPQGLDYLITHLNQKSHVGDIFYLQSLEKIIFGTAADHGANKNGAITDGHTDVYAPNLEKIYYLRSTKDWSESIYQLRKKLSQLARNESINNATSLFLVKFNQDVTSKLIQQQKLAARRPNDISTSKVSTSNEQTHHAKQIKAQTPAQVLKNQKTTLDDYDNYYNLMLIGLLCIILAILAFVFYLKR